jgi:hypothetical protein
MKSMMLISIFCILENGFGFGQEVKKYNGPLEDGRSHGVASYQYFEDPQTYKRIKTGAFSYNYSGEDGETGFKINVTGNFIKGLKDGKWTYSIQLNDYERGSDYKTGTITLVANYKNGYAEGNWKEVRSIKTRTKKYSLGKYYWEPFSTVKNLSISMNFRDGFLKGPVNISDDFDNFYLTGNYSDSGFAEGTWVIKDRAWGQYKDLIYKEGVLYETIFRESDGQASSVSKFHDKYDDFLKLKALDESQKDDSGIVLDTICGENCAATSYLLQYFKKLLSTDYFPYSDIGGDLTFSQDISGGCELKISKQTREKLADNQNYKKGLELKKESDWLNAYDKFQSIPKSYLNRSDKEQLLKEINELNPLVERSIEKYHENSKIFFAYIDSQYRTSELKFNELKKDFKIKLITEYNSSTYQTVQKDPKPLSYNTNCKEPWNERYLMDGINCMKSNTIFFEPYQLIWVESYYNFLIFLEGEEKKIKETSKNFSYNSTNHSFYTYSIETFNNELFNALELFKLAENIVLESKKYEDIFNQIVKAHTANKKKTILKKYNLVTADFLNKYKTGSNSKEYLNLLMEFNKFQEKVLYLYSIDSDDLEKKLKDAESIEQIKTIISG